MATRGRPKKILDNDYDFYVEKIKQLEEVETNLKRQLDEKENELGSLEDELEHLREIIKSLAEVL
jgi:chromosome segregation ATPase